MSRVKDWLKKTPLYPILRAGWHLVRRESRGQRIERRDARDAAAILRRVLGPGGSAIDVGAHAGEVLAQFVRLSPACRHVAVEPIPELAERLRADFPRVAVHQAACGESPGTAEFQWVVTNPAFSGLLRRPDLRPEDSVRTVAVPVVRVDDLVPSGFPVALVKIDVEGAELGVLRGAARVLAENRPWVLFEHGTAAAAYGTTTAAVAAEFARHGLAVWLPGVWLGGGDPLSPEAFEAAVASGDYWNFLAGPAP